MSNKKKILLMGNPNVGKSVIFSKLTGMHVESSNYAGTTVDYTLGDIDLYGEEGILIDVPGTYSLSATSEAEQVAVGLLYEGADAIICVLDAVHLDRNLDLALKLKEQPIPIVYCLNLVDIAERQGIIIDHRKLEEELKAPVVPTIAIRNVGLRDLLHKTIDVVREGPKDLKEKELTDEQRWKEADRITNNVQRQVIKEETFI